MTGSGDLETLQEKLAIDKLRMMWPNDSTEVLYEDIFISGDVDEVISRDTLNHLRSQCIMHFHFGIGFLNVICVSSSTQNYQLNVETGDFGG